MEILKSVLQWSIYLSVAINAVVVYLNINKMWSRKHEPVVADSISVAAQAISFITILPFLISYGFKESYGDAFYQFLWLVYTAFLILTGIGFWVKDRRYVGVWQKFLGALRQESDELGNLTKSLGNLRGKKQLLAILHHLAWLDNRLDERECRYLQAFTNQLDIDAEFILDEKPPEEGIEKFKSLCQLVREYLAIKPPIEQIQLLGDLVQVLIAADDEITPEEETSAEEISGMVDDYINPKEVERYSIVIHPKNREQEKAILATIPDLKEEVLLGDRAFIAGRFYTRNYAEIISESYRNQGWFTVVHENSANRTNASEYGTVGAEHEPSLST